MILVNNILYDEEAGEADVELKSKNICIKCYCHPVENLKEIYEAVNNPLSAFLVKDIMLNDCTIPQVVKTNDGYYSYYLSGRVISARKIQIHDFIIDVGTMPKDIKIGEYISCHCLRLDVLI